MQGRGGGLGCCIYRQQSATLDWLAGAQGTSACAILCSWDTNRKKGQRQLNMWAGAQLCPTCEHPCTVPHTRQHRSCRCGALQKPGRGTRWGMCSVDGRVTPLPQSKQGPGCGSTRSMATSYGSPKKPERPRGGPTDVEGQQREHDELVAVKQAAARVVEDRVGASVQQGLHARLQLLRRHDVVFAVVALLVVLGDWLACGAGLWGESKGAEGFPSELCAM